MTAGEHAMVQHARLALEAHGRGDTVAYRTHAAQARELAAYTGLQVLRRDTPPRPLRPFSTDFGIEGPDEGSDFLKQENALTEAVRWCAVPLLAWTALCLAAGFAARSLGWI